MHFSKKTHVHARTYAFTCHMCKVLIILLFFIFSKNGVSYFNPSVHNEFSFYVERIKRSCSLLLFVITNNTTGVPELIEVIGRKGERGREGERGIERG